MKLTKQQLKQIIKEELNNLHEGQFDDTGALVHANMQIGAAELVIERVWHEGEPH